MLRHKLGLAICVVLILTAMAWVSTAPSTSADVAYSLLALMAFGLKLADGSTMGFVFIIQALPVVGWSEALLMAGSALFIQAVGRRERPASKTLLVSLGSTAAAVLASQAVFHAPWIARLDVPLRLMLAAGACFLAQRAFNFAKSDLWSFVYYPVAAAIAALFPVSLVLPPLVYLTWRSYRRYERRLEQQREQSRTAASLHFRTIEALTLAIEAKDRPLDHQPRRVQVYAVEIAKELGLPALEIEALRAASLLYDIGELAVPEHIMSKPGPLTTEEYEKVKIHPSVGAAILERVNFPYPVAPVVAAHHERWDGSGYPAGLKGEAIPICARILSAVDALHSLASARHHRSAISLEAAVRKISNQSGSAFDPRIVSLIRKGYKRWERLVEKQPSDQFIQTILSAQREGHVVSDFMQKLSGTLDLHEIFSELNSSLRSLIRFETVVVWVEREDRLSAEYVDGAHVALCASLKIPLGSGVSGRVAAQGKAIVNGDASAEIAHTGKDPLTCPFRCALAVPLEGGGVRGSLTVYRMAERPFSIEEAGVLSAMTPKLALAVAKGLQYRQTAEQASTDPLTGLPNAGALFTQLRLGGHAAVLVCDLDGFKQVNDRFGHMTGNLVLKSVAEGFRRSCRGEDFIARMGGDEFALLLCRIAPQELGLRIAQFREMVRAVGRQICGEDVVDASFGAAFYPDHGSTPEELLAFADSQMYRRKAEQKEGVLSITTRPLEPRKTGSSTLRAASSNT